MNDILLLAVDISRAEIKKRHDKEYWLSCSDDIFEQMAYDQGKVFSLDEFQNELNLGLSRSEFELYRFVNRL